MQAKFGHPGSNLVLLSYLRPPCCSHVLLSESSGSSLPSLTAVPLPSHVHVPPTGKVNFCHSRYPHGY